MTPSFGLFGVFELSYLVDGKIFKYGNNLISKLTICLFV